MENGWRNLSTKSSGFGLESKFETKKELMKKKKKKKNGVITFSFCFFVNSVIY